jgi:hypothetical protein
VRGKPGENQYLTHTVTRLDVIFRYPDWVPLTHFVHIEQKSYGAAWLSYGAAWLSYGVAWLRNGAAWLSYGAVWLSS